MHPNNISQSSMVPLDVFSKPAALLASCSFGSFVIHFCTESVESVSRHLWDVEAVVVSWKYI